ncbi:MAG: hypothetical protein ACK5LN_07970 [Propioniciclava sp.]
MATTFTIAHLLYPNITGLLEPDVLDRLASDLRAEIPTAENQTKRLQGLAILKLSGTKIDEFSKEIAKARSELVGTQDVANAPQVNTIELTGVRKAYPTAAGSARSSMTPPSPSPAARSCISTAPLVPERAP